MHRPTPIALIKLLGLALLGWVSTVAAQEWPKQKPISFVVAFGAGSITDTLARMIGQKLSESLGQAVVVDNRPGAGGNIGVQRVKNAAPDGYTILMHSVAYTVNPALFANAGYDPLNDFVPLILAASTPNAISVHPSVPAKSLQELIKLSRQHPLAYASPGIGTSPHLSMERIKAIAKIDITHVPYQPAQAVNALIGGQTPVLSISVSIQLPQIKAGRIRALSVTSARRSPFLPEVPTVAEQGFAGYEELNWFGIFAPAALPAGIAGRLNAEMNRVLELPDIREKFGQLGLDFSRNSLADFARFIKDEVPKQAKAVKDSGVKVE
ncbi:MAG: Bug family tripartite tricarboxylate transporter substrate binding protein [Burkholderiales bacterium]